ncbi:MAG: hypothetical protein ACXVJW_07980, partial [Acidimicrobiia bacterium]
MLKAYGLPSWARANATAVAARDDGGGAGCDGGEVGGGDGGVGAAAGLWVGCGAVVGLPVRALDPVAELATSIAR